MRECVRGRMDCPAGDIIPIIADPIGLAKVRVAATVRWREGHAADGRVAVAKGRKESFFETRERAAISRPSFSAGLAISKNYRMCRIRDSPT